MTSDSAAMLKGARGPVMDARLLPDGWSADPLLGEEFSIRRLDVPAAATPSDRGPAPSTVLIRYDPSVHNPPCASVRAAIVLVHGYNDYFFHASSARLIAQMGLAVFGVDLRRAGRAWLPGQVAHYQADLRETGADLSAAVAAVRRELPGIPVIVHAHSTGGLMAALWAHAHRRRVSGPDLLILDSPFFATPRPRWVRETQRAAAETVAAVNPMQVVSHSPSIYAASLLADYGGRWEFDRRLKTPLGVPVRAGWLRAVTRGQSRVARGLEIAVPVMVARSARSGVESRRNPDLDRQDVVVDVGEIARLAPGLGRNVTEVVVDGGVHDLLLSGPEPRSAYLVAMRDWLGVALGARGPASVSRTGR